MLVTRDFLVRAAILGGLGVLILSVVLTSPILQSSSPGPPFKILLDASGRVAQTIPDETTAAAILEALEAVT